MDYYDKVMMLIFALSCLYAAVRIAEINVTASSPNRRTKKET